MNIPVTMERATSGASLLSLWFPNVQPNNKSNTIVIEFTIISGTEREKKVCYYKKQNKKKLEEKN